ncbi:MAG: hypothetical protein ABR575_11290 [Actinomycetota bacterium]
MPGHELWHVLVLVVVLLGVAGAALAVLAPVLFDEPSGGAPRSRRRAALGGLAAAIGAVTAEWLWVH